MAIHLTFEEASSLLADVVAEKGESYKYADYYGACVYFGTGVDGYVPACIVGHVLARKGLTFEDLGGDAIYGSMNAGCGVDILLQRGVLTVDHDVTAKLLAWAQEDQDTGIAWGAAVKNARERVEAP